MQDSRLLEPLGRLTTTERAQFNAALDGIAATWTPGSRSVVTALLALAGKYLKVQPDLAGALIAAATVVETGAELRRILDAEREASNGTWPPAELTSTP